MIWQILIATTHDRWDVCDSLVLELERQIDQLDLSSKVGLLINEDNYEKSIGKKRQELLEQSTADYINYFDSDDFPEPLYVLNVYAALKQGVDCLGIKIKMTTNGENPKMCCHSIKYPEWNVDVDGYDYVRNCTHFNPIKRSIAIQVGFSDKRFGEDKEYSDAVTKLCKDEIFLEEPVFNYRYSNKIPHNEKYGIVVKPKPTSTLTPINTKPIINMRNAIVVLTRGYNSVDEYNILIKRNKCIETFIGCKYPLVIFHEGNITFSQQDYIQRATPDLKISFVDVSEVWDARFGYESMCRFNSYHLWNYCKEFDNVFRIDEDCFITSLEEDPFESMGKNVYLKSVYWAESHTETNETLPQKIEKLTAVDRSVFYNNKFPYTNVSVSNVQFWLQSPITEVLKEISVCKEQTDNRWGDLPVLGSLLNIYAVGKVGDIYGLKYEHISHANEIESVKRNAAQSERKSMTTDDYLQQNLAGFENDIHAKEKFRSLIEGKVDVMIETGTYLGSTTKHFAEWCPKVYTIEINQANYIKAKAALASNKNVELLLASSEKGLSMLLTLASNFEGKSVGYWLDAHWLDYNPLLDELKVIADHKQQPTFIAIHDFKVPGKPELGFDSYKGQDYDWEWIEESVNAIYGIDGYDVVFNDAATGAARGIVYITKKIAA